MYALVAHAGEHHDSAAQTVGHFLQDWFFALPLLLLAVVVVATLAYFLTGKSRPAVFLAVVATLLVLGILFYSTSPLISVVALAVGFGLTLIMVLTSLLAPVANDK